MYSSTSTLDEGCRRTREVLRAPTRTKPPTPMPSKTTKKNVPKMTKTETETTTTDDDDKEMADEGEAMDPTRQVPL